MSAFRVLVLISFAIAATSASVVNPTNTAVEKQDVKIYTDTAEVPATEGNGEQLDETVLVTPYTYKAVMLQNVPGRKVACWRCSYPCNSYMCCDDGYPQCCCTNCNSSAVRCYCCRY